MTSLRSVCRAAEGRLLEINPETDVVLYSTHMQVKTYGMQLLSDCDF